MEDKEFLLRQVEIIEHYAQLQWEQDRLFNRDGSYSDIIREAAGVMRRVLDGTITVPRVVVVERKEP